jgi:hypothetical protein
MAAATQGRPLVGRGQVATEIGSQIATGALRRRPAARRERLQDANMKEPRFKAADGVWRVAFAFDPERTGILLVAGAKCGTSERRFYKRLIAKADEPI